MSSILNSTEPKTDKLDEDNEPKKLATRYLSKILIHHCKF